MKIFGKELDKEGILKRIGDISQLGGMKCYQFTDGVSKGIRAVDLKCICGIDMTVLIDRAMDISYLSYKSIPVSWKSATRETSSIYYESKGDEIARTFYGGLLTTCGLTYMGYPCIDEGEELSLHGRISNLPAENVCVSGKWESNTYVMEIGGKVRETKVFGDKLELERKITTWIDIPKIVVEDTVINIGSRKSPLMILYHVNIGYPVLDSSSKLLEGPSKVTPMDRWAKKGLGEYSKFSEPTSDFKQQIFFHDIEKDEEGYGNVAIVNPAFNNSEGIGLWLRFSKESLPYLIQCKQMGGGEYFCGIEPANSLIRGRKVEREKGTLKFIEPDEEVKYRLEFNILTSNKDIKDFEDKYCKN